MLQGSTSQLSLQRSESLTPPPPYAALCTLFVNAPPLVHNGRQPNWMREDEWKEKGSSGRRRRMLPDFRKNVNEVIFPKGRHYFCG